MMANTHIQTHRRRQLQIPGPEYILLLAVSQMSVTSTRTPASHREFVSEKFASSFFPGDQLASCETHILFVLGGKPQENPRPKMASLWNFVVNSFRGLCLALTFGL